MKTYFNFSEPSLIEPEFPDLSDYIPKKGDEVWTNAGNTFGRFFVEGVSKIGSKHYLTVENYANSLVLCLEDDDFDIYPTPDNDVDEYYFEEDHWL
jgi:hypothetical protein